MNISTVNGDLKRVQKRIWNSKPNYVLNMFFYNVVINHRVTLNEGNWVCCYAKHVCATN